MKNTQLSAITVTKMVICVQAYIMAFLASRVLRVYMPYIKDELNTAYIAIGVYFLLATVLLVICAPCLMKKAWTINPSDGLKKHFLYYFVFQNISRKSFESAVCLNGKIVRKLIM